MLAEGLRDNNRVMVLELTSNEIHGKEGAEAVYDILVTYGNTIRKLILDKNPLGDAGIDKLS